MVISAPEAPTAALQQLLENLGHSPSVAAATLAEPHALLQEAHHWGIPLRRSDDSLSLKYPHAPLSAAEIADGAGIPESRIRVLPACASTNTELFNSPSDLGICLAESQWAGRGRRARHWSSPFGLHLAMSMAWSQNTRINPALTLVAGLSVFQVLKNSVKGLWIKWPNDIWVNDRKLGGILLETRRLTQQSLPDETKLHASPSHAANLLVLGLGLNVHHDASLPDSAVSLAQLHVNLSRSQLAGQILQRWQADFARFDREGLQAFLPLWTEAAAPMVDAIVQISDAWGHYPAQVRGIGADGRLQVQESGKAPVWLSAGDVSLRPLVS
ncbi:biotin--[acetyl-CoA-carboxylase] ligase [Acidithiobacillus montserratensis]|uniref:Biotin--[acetyl-CoA-carboxylase] ligase n=1 Tax=Acidithiobacillus montserratensis TaxID=2729135 RepID=A0ACD5HDZ4_9PROT|nr:biotin--[acetyl-CoA-carboxylase] ligase [Acidithiobacillus montserratensis]MBU2748377.1 biotin--[acetyl-CoA-carboxylase] ligase [Acidithiobacillus montserratensis]